VIKTCRIIILPEAKSCLTQREENRLITLEKTLSEEYLDLREEKATIEWRKLQNEEP
jgi:hypothetical protein